LYKMQQMDLPWQYVKYVRNFLSGRKTRVEVNRVRSNNFRLDQGLPQGSSISPLLFLIFINDIDVELEAETTASLFADDTATWVQDGKIRGSKRVLMQEEVNKILSWALKWKMRVNADKTKTMIISTSATDKVWDPQITAGENAISTVKKYKFLGVTVDNDLRFNDHITNITVKCRKRVNILKCLAAKDWGNSQETQRNIFIQYIRSVLEYASSSWSSWISKTNREHLQRIQNQGLRAVTSLARTCPIDLLHLEARVEPLRDRYEKNDDITWDRYARLPGNDSRKRLLETRVLPRLKTRLGWRNTTAQRMDSLNIEREETTPPMVPWAKLTNVITDAVALEKKKSEHSEDELRTLSLRKINSIATVNRIYTDGSTNEHQENGGAGIFVETEGGEVLYEASFPAGKWCSSYTGECVAALKALEWIRDNPADCLICTDSLSLQQAIATNDWKDRDPWLKRIKNMLLQIESKVTFLWVPSHCDIYGNNKADELAKRGTESNQDGIPVTHAIVKAKIKGRKWQVTHDRVQMIYKDKREPNVEVERLWPRKVRTLFSRLRTGHAKELAYYRYLIESEDDPRCTECGEEDETIEHVLCRCVALEEERRRQKDGEMTIDQMVTDPETCRKILQKRFAGLLIKNDGVQANQQ
jgi:ribonuclease HI